MTDCISNSKYVSLTYTITDDSEEILESIDVPITFIHGNDDNIIPKIEKVLEGHNAGDQVSVDISPEEGFGPSPERTNIYRWPR